MEYGTAGESFGKGSVGYHLRWKIPFREILKVDRTNGKYLVALNRMLVRWDGSV